MIKYFAHTNMAKNVALILIAAHSAVQKGNRNPKQKRNIGKEYDNSVPELLFVWFDSLRPINNLSVKQGRVFLGCTSAKLG